MADCDFSGEAEDALFFQIVPSTRWRAKFLTGDYAGKLFLQDANFVSLDAFFLRPTAIAYGRESEHEASMRKRST